jgi:hypothetical protein
VGPNSGLFCCAFLWYFQPPELDSGLFRNIPDPLCPEFVGLSSTASIIAARSAARLHSESWLCRPSEEVGSCSGGGFGPGLHCTGRSSSEGNPHGAPVPSLVRYSLGLHGRGGWGRGQPGLALVPYGTIAGPV